MKASKQPLLMDLPRTRRRRRLMDVIDAGNGCWPELGRYYVHLKCSHCGHDDGWHVFRTKQESLSESCPKCNGTGTESEREG